MGKAKLADRLFKLAESDVHVWPVVTQASEAVGKELESVLQPEEKRRADKFRFAHLRRAFIVGRSALRILLGRYLNVSPASIKFSYEPTGKPGIAGNAPVRFNISHSEGLTVIAIAVHCDIGIDVEQIRPIAEMHEIAERCFCSEEAAELLSLPSDQRERAFFLCWTRKEAYIKATGDGLSTNLKNFRVTMRPGEPAALLRLANDANAARSWTFHELNLAPNYAAALAYRDTPRQLSIFPSIELVQLLDIQ